MNPNTPGSCEGCGASLPASIEGGLCPRCLLGAALDDPDSSSAEADTLPSDSESSPHDASDSLEQAGTTIGRYKLLQQIGEGGFGTVWMAEQSEPVKRRVALKVIKAGMDSKEVIARFEAERQALAMMDHPNIAKVHDAGTTDRGRPYFVMELVKGIPITTYCADLELETKARLTLFMDVCAAVQHAHQKGIIHRDLKPSNILVSPHDGKPVIKVIDFGIAKAITAELTDKTLFTQLGRMMGTPQYMSPEQAELNALDVDTRSDIYSLGVLLYELLTGTPPLDGEKLRSAAYGEIQRLIREETPPKPSTRISALRSQAKSVSTPGTRNPQNRKLTGELSRDLDWIVMKALEKDRARRYETASGFALDVQRFLDQQPVLAGPPGIGYKMGKFVGRNRAAFAAGAAVVAALVVGTVVSVVFAIRAESEKEAAQYNEGLGWMLRAQVAEKEGHRYPDTLLYAARAIGFDGLGRPVGNLNDLPQLITEKRDPVDYRRARDWITGRPAYLPFWSSGNQPEAPVTAMVLDPSGKWLAIGSAEGVRLFDLETGMNSLLPQSSKIYDLAVDPWGEVLVIAAEEGLFRWNLKAAGFEAALIYPDSSKAPSIHAIVWSPAGELLAGAGDDGSILLWQDAAGSPRRIETGHTIGATNLTYSPENAFIAATFPNAAPQVVFPEDLALSYTWIDLAAGQAAKMDERDRDAFLKWANDAAETTCVAVSTSGFEMATGRATGGVTLWDTLKAAPLGEIPPQLRHQGIVRAIAFRADGAQLASGGDDGLIKLWSVSGKSLALEATLTGHQGAVTRLTYGPGGQILASGGADGSAKLWDVSGRKVTSPDLYAFLKNDWYGLTPEANWDAGRGFIDAAAATVPARWRKEPSDNPVERLIADAKAAATEKRWRRLAMRARELARHGATLPENLTTQARAASNARGEKAGDVFINGESQTMIWCPPTPPEGFVMGSPETEANRKADEPGHIVHLTEGFWLGQTEVTQRAWSAIMGRNPATYKEDVWKPVEQVSRQDAMTFCRRMTDRERMRGMLPLGWEYSLPTEAQWEYACRAGSETPWNFGPADQTTSGHGNFDQAQDDATHTATVKTYPPNGWGFYDMHGNVSEWCRDWYQEDYYRGGQRDPVGPEAGAFRVLRGGSWSDAAVSCRSASRSRSTPDSRSSHVGFRVAIVPTLPPEERGHQIRLAFQQGVDSGFGAYGSTTDRWFRPGREVTKTDEFGVDAGGPKQHIEALCRFGDIVGNLPGKIPPGARIISATLRVVVNNGGHPPMLYQMATDWDADTLTYDNAKLRGNSLPGIQEDDCEAFAPPYGATRALSKDSIDVTTSVQNWVNGDSNFGWVFKPAGGNAWVVWSSTAFPIQRRPELIVYYDPSGPDPVAAWQQAVKRDPNQPSVQYWLGKALCEAGRFEEALAPLQAVHDLSPGGARGEEILYRLAQVYRALGRDSDADGIQNELDSEGR